MSGTFFWGDTPIAFNTGQTVAIALTNAGISSFGESPTGVMVSVFCGIGQCQNCLVKVDGKALTESCLLLCSEGLRVFPQNLSCLAAGGSDD